MYRRRTRHHSKQSKQKGPSGNEDTVGKYTLPESAYQDAGKPRLMTLTTNMAITNVDSDSAVLDLFAQGGALRQATLQDIVNRFASAWKENPLLAMKCLFYLRDIRGKGQGERRTFRVCLEWLKRRAPGTFTLNLELVPQFGRWDDLWRASLTGPCSQEIIAFVKKQLRQDKEALADEKKPISLLAKWLPSENASSKETIALARTLQQALGMSAKEYRKLLSQLRGRLDVVEKRISARDWAGVVYEHVPSKAGLLYRCAFQKHDQERYEQYIKDVTVGKTKINASVLYPYDIVRQVAQICNNEPYGQELFENVPSSTVDRDSLDAMWKALPDYLAENPHNGLVVPDVSGSMFTRDGNVAPIHISVSLAIYFAQRCKGYFAGRYVEFSSQAAIRTLEAKNICDAWEEVSTSTTWCGSTNLQSVFDVILKAAKSNRVSVSDMPSVLYIISDMQFNQACNSNARTNFEEMQRKYMAAGYPMPTVCFWNVNAAYGRQSPVTRDENGVMLVSGCSPSIFSLVMNGKTVTPYELMLEALNDDRYSCVQVAAADSG